MKTHFRGSTVTSRAARPYVCLTVSRGLEVLVTITFSHCGSFVVSRTSIRSCRMETFLELSPDLHISTPEWMILKIGLQAATGTAVQARSRLYAFLEW